MNRAVSALTRSGGRLASAEELHMHATERAGDRPNLLLIDDTVGERDLYEMVLAPEFRIVTAARGDDGIAMAIAQHPDVVVLDVMMPGLDGWTTCSRIKSDPATADIPVILLTGVADGDLSQHATAVGASAVLQKPCPGGALRDAIFGALAGKVNGGDGGNGSTRSNEGTENHSYTRKN